MNFNFIAPYYDRIARIVFGQSIVESQINHFGLIRPGAKVLVIGGGTGWILKHLPADCEKVVFVEPSREMIGRAARESVRFPLYLLKDYYENITINEKYDAIIANYFFDMFSKNDLDQIADKMKRSLSESGLLFATDFTNMVGFWHRSMLIIMYTFFWMVAGIPNRKLCNWQQILMSNGLRIVHSSRFYGGFIISTVYRK